MIGQPSVNDLASMFRGNPGPLQAKVNQEMQGQPPGTLPEDLHELLALQIVTNEQDAKKRNAAMQQLQQMQPQGPQGEPPTVAQSLQQQAQQKLQAQMVQQMRQQQGLQALAQQAPLGAVPPETPQPEDQPEAQGLDMLRSGMGENYAGGGIIAFDGTEGSQVPEASEDKYETPYDRRNRELNESGRRFGDPKDLEGIKKALAFVGAPVAALGDILSLPVNVLRNLVRNPLDVSERPSLTPASDARREFLNLPEDRPAPQPTPTVRPTMANDPRMLTSDQGQALAAADMAESRVGRNVGRMPPRGLPAAVMPPAPAASAAPVSSAREQFLASEFNRTPETIGAERRAAYASEVGQRSTADLASLADDIVARRQALKSRADPLIDFLQGIALAPRGEKWMQSGVRGKVYADEQRAAREAQDMALMQKLMETKGKITDIEQGYKEKLFGIDKDAVDNAYNRKYAAAKEMGLDDRLARELAAKAAEGEKDRQNRLVAARIQAGARGDPALAAAINAVKSDEVINALQKRLELESKKLGPKAAATVAELERRIAARQDAIYKAFNVSVPASTMGTAPGAESPGGTASGWGKAQVVK